MEIKKEYKVGNHLRGYSVEEEKDKIKITFTDEEIKDIMHNIFYDIDKLWEERTDITTGQLESDGILDDVFQIICNHLLIYKDID